MNKRNFGKLFLMLIFSILVICLAIGIGSVHIPLKEQFYIFAGKIFSINVEDKVNMGTVSILTTVRMPRAILAFLVGGGLAVAGVVTQSILQNPLASSYTLGVSSGAALGAAIITVCEISVPVLGLFLLPAGGFIGGFIVVIFVISVSQRIDHGVTSYTVVLTGMVASMFTNAILTLLSVLFVKHEHHIIGWTLGSFNGKRWYHVWILLVADIVILILNMKNHRELDALSFGDEHAASLGVEVAKIKKRQLLYAAFLTGVSVCFTGTIGFIDLIAPHVSRKIVGATHRWTLPVSFLLGGSLMTIADLVARTALAPLEIPVGAVTALIGAPFFMWLYFGRGRSKL